jgi:hypothetical protein
MEQKEIGRKGPAVENAVAAKKGLDAKREVSECPLFPPDLLNLLSPQVEIDHEDPSL